MQPTFVFAVFLFQLGLGEVLNGRAGCNADNCLRKIRGTALVSPDVTSRIADCSSFLQVTVQPQPTTVTVTEYSNPQRKRDLGNEDRGLVEKRQATTITPQNVPTYASACSGTARYSSACSCAGVTGVTTTAPTPTVTVTVLDCSPYGTNCNGTCRDLYFDENNCGTCGNVCPAGSQCRGKCLFPKDFECSNITPANSSDPLQPCKPKSEFCVCGTDPGSSLGGRCVRRRQLRWFCARNVKCPGLTNAECPADSFCWTNSGCFTPVCIPDYGWCEDMTNPLLD